MIPPLPYTALAFAPSAWATEASFLFPVCQALSLCRAGFPCLKPSSFPFFFSSLGCSYLPFRSWLGHHISRKPSLSNLARSSTSSLLAALLAPCTSSSNLEPHLRVYICSWRLINVRLWHCKLHGAEGPVCFCPPFHPRCPMPGMKKRSINFC